MACRWQGFPWSSRATHLYHPSLSVVLPCYIMYYCRAVVYRLWARSYFSDIVLSYHARLVWIVFEMGSRCLYNWCFVGWCIRDMLNTAQNILAQLPSSFLSLHLVSFHMVHPFNSIDTTAAWKKLRFIYSVRFDFHMTDSQSMALHAFASCVLISFSVDETLLPK